jgi:hypothetical protein
MADLISELSGIIDERLPSIFRLAQPSTFPLLERAQRTVAGVRSTKGDQTDIGRLYNVKHGWQIGSAGMLRSTNPYGSAALDVGVEARITDQSNTDGNLAPIPPAAESPHVGDFVRTLYLHANVGNLGIPLAWKFADSLDATKLKLLVRDMKACAEKTRRQDAISYSSYRATNASTYKTTVLSRITTFAKTTHALRAGSTNANFVDIVIDERYGTIANFHEGDELDIVANSGGAAGTAGTLQDGAATDGTDVRNYTSGAVYVQVIVTKVDRLTNTITVMGIARNTGSADAIVAFDNATGWQGTNGVANFDWICPRAASVYSAGTRPWLTNGLEDWIATSGQIMGGAQYSQGLDLNEYPMFKSIIRANLAGPLTEDTLDGVSAVAGERFPNVKINAWVSTRGVLLKFKQELQTGGTATSKWERTNAPFKVKGGWTLADYVTPEGTYEWWTSPYCLKNTMYGQQIDPSNLKLYSHKLIGATKETFAEGIQFLGPLIGYPGLVVPESASNGTPNLITGTPWIRFALLCPIMPNGWKIGGITEADMLSLVD